LQARRAGVVLAKNLPRDVAEKIEVAIERHHAAADALIAFLDACDGDTDVEEVCEDEGASNELDCSYAETHGKGGKAEAKSEDIEDSLGWTGDVNQDRALSNCKGIVTLRDGTWFERGGDLEQQHDGREPSLGSRPCVGNFIGSSTADASVWNQVLWAFGGSDDRELADDRTEGDDKEDHEPRVAPVEPGGEA
jgi:hypothetical protein